MEWKKECGRKEEEEAATDRRMEREREGIAPGEREAVCIHTHEVSYLPGPGKKSLSRGGMIQQRAEGLQTFFWVIHACVREYIRRVGEKSPALLSFVCTLLYCT